MIYGRVVFTDYRVCPLRASLAANVRKQTEDLRFSGKTQNRTLVRKDLPIAEEVGEIRVARDLRMHIEASSHIRIWIRMGGEENTWLSCTR
jgi:hypothetical protein